MRRGLILSVALAALGVASAQGDYRDLRAAFEQYQPPSHLFRHSAEAPPEAPAENDAFEAEKQRLLDLKTRWGRGASRLIRARCFLPP